MELLCVNINKLQIIEEREIAREKRAPVGKKESGKKKRKNNTTT